MNPIQPHKYDSTWHRRLKHAKEFLKDIKGKNVLGIGESNNFDYLLAEYFWLKYAFTESDLNFTIDAPQKIYDNIFCFEVLEHLLNPLTCLVNIKKYMDKNTRLYVSIPQNKAGFWWVHHFHEYNDERFAYLLETAGLEVIREKRIVIRYDWSFYFTGIRPLIRLLWAKPYVHFFELKLKP